MAKDYNNANANANAKANANASKFPADQRDTSNPADRSRQGGSNSGMGKDYGRQQQQGERPGSQGTRNPTDKSDR